MMGMRPVKILVADDSLTFLSMISESLTHLGHEVIQASNGDEVLTLFQTSQPDLVILDVVMGGMGGFECARLIRQISPDDWIPIIFLSSSITDESIAKGIDAGGDDYLTKPCSDITLEAKIKAMQRIAQMRQQLLHKTDELKRISSTDTLTGLFNRFQFEKIIREKMAAAARHQFNLALLFVDVDHFKGINDTFGHGVGDLLLKDVANRLLKHTRMDDFVARIGGDEFVIILSQIDNSHAACEVAEKLINELSQDYQLDGREIKITASIGVTCYPEQDGDVATVIQNADIAMYAAKEQGRNNYQMYTDALNVKYRHQLGLEHELKFAIERGQLHVSYQPIFDLLTKEILGAEALVEWRHSEYGVISPNVFIPIAEQSGLIVDIGNWVLRDVCTHGAKWIVENHPNFIVSVKVSIHQLISENFTEMMNEMLHETKFPAENIEIELAESNAITFTAYIKESMRVLQDLGIRLSINDFGTRYSTLTSLKTLPIATLKIDRQFISKVDTDKKNAIIVKSLIALGENLNLRVVSDGIHTLEELQFLLVNGCRIGQGDYLMRPLSYDHFTDVLNNCTKEKE